MRLSQRVYHRIIASLARARPAVRAVVQIVVLPLLVVLAMALMLLLMPVWLPFLAWSEAADRRRLRAAASVPCAVCGGPLGQAALDRSDASWKDHVAALHEAHPGMRFRLVRRSRVECPACGARYEYDRDRRGLALVADEAL